MAPVISLVVPMYNEARGMALLFERVMPVLSSITPDWDIVCVNDGSQDETLALLKEWHAKEPRVKFLSLSRNFGKEAALSAGLHHAFGQAVIPFDADLQDPPEMIPDMVREWQSGYKVVLATRTSRAGEGWFKRSSAWLYYKFINRVTSIEIPPNTGDFRLMDQQVVEVLRQFPERSRYMKGLFAWVGFKTTVLYFDRQSRMVGAPKQSLRKLWQLAKDGVFSFTTAPLRITTYMGVLISLIAMSYAIWLLLRVMYKGVDVPGYASIMAAVLFMGGIQLISIGILGEYIGRAYREAKRRPVYIIEEISERL